MWVVCGCLLEVNSHAKRPVDARKLSGQQAPWLLCINAFILSLASIRFHCQVNVPAGTLVKCTNARMQSAYTESRKATPVSV